MTLPDPNSISPRVSVVVPVHNADRYLSASIESILNQSLQDFELILVNDCSQDKSPFILKAYESLNDPRIRIIHNPINIKAGASRNRAIAIARGDYIAFHDADDISLPKRLEQQVHYLDTHPMIGLVASRIKVIDYADRPLPGGNSFDKGMSAAEIKAALPHRDCIATPSIMLRRTLFTNQQFSEKFLMFADDYEFWLRLAAEDCKMTVLDDVLVHYRHHDLSVTRLIYAQRHPLHQICRAKIAFIYGRVRKAKFGKFERIVFANLLKDLFDLGIYESKRLVLKGRGA